MESQRSVGVMIPLSSLDPDPSARAATRPLSLVTLCLWAALGAAAGQILWLASQPALTDAWQIFSAALGAVAGMAVFMAVFMAVGAAARPLTAIEPPSSQAYSTQRPGVEAPVVSAPNAVSFENFCGAPVRDEVTGVYNPLNFVAAADREWSRFRRHGEDATLLLLEVDHFKRLNHAYGRLCGDTMLDEVTRMTCTSLRGHDLPARFGEGMLVVYLPQTELLGALDAAERIRKKVADLTLDWQGQRVSATVSLGVASVSAAHASLDAVVIDASTALREAQTVGGNCVRAAPPHRKSESERSTRR
jgi:diguanylate cyclase (GGDEF)-like protein